MSIIKSYWPIWVLALLVIFGFPLKVGLKADPAVYSTIARNIVDSGVLWPLRFAPTMFEKFYEHPPLVPWLMAAVMKLLGPSEWSAALLSRVLAILSLMILPLVFLSPSRRTGDLSFPKGKALMAIVVTLTWVPWIKYVGSAQYEGPLTFCLVLAFFLILRGFDQNYEPWHAAILMLVGLCGFLVKGVIFFPILGIPLAFGIFRREIKRGLLLSVSLSGGWGIGVLIMMALDAAFQTSWTATYWNRIFGWGFQASPVFDPAAGIEVTKHFSLALKTLIVEFEMSPLWTPVLWGSMLFILIFRPRRLLSNPPLLLSFLFYWFFLSPFMIATIKMPHWPVPIYPVASIFLIHSLPSSWFSVFENLSVVRRYLVPMVLVVATVMALMIYPTQSRWGRGEEWVFHKQVIQEHIDQTKPLKLATDSMPMYMMFAYSAWFLGPDFPVSYNSLDQHLRSECRGLLWVHPVVSRANESSIKAMGWKKTVHQHENVALWECLASSAGF